MVRNHLPKIVHKVLNFANPRNAGKHKETIDLGR
jgi:hypothetical protein